MTSPFLQFLVSRNALSQEDAQFVNAQYEAGSMGLDAALLEHGKFDDDALLGHKGEFYHLPTVSFENKLIDRNLLGLFSKEVITNYRIVPFEKQGDSVRIAMLDPENLKAREAVDFLARQKGWNTQFYVTTEKSFKHALDQYSGSLTSEVGEALEYADQSKEEQGEKKQQKEEDQDLEEVVKSAPVSKMVSVILRHAVEGGASDIHIEPQENESRVRYRIDGDLHATLSLPKYIHNSIISRIKVLANLKLDETRKPQDGRIHMEVGGKQIDFRISTLPLAGTEKVVMRILDVTRGAPTLDNLGFLGRNLEAMQRQLTKPNGMFLVTGPTGSGKSTTLFSALSILNQEKVNIITLEDPIEYYLPGANQSQVRPEVGYTFASGLRSILRQDPDIIMVGEIRDNETAALAVQAALTGHIVLSTLHTNDALGSVPRLIDMKVEPFLLATTLNIIQAQRLVRKICQHCKEETELPPDLAKKAQAVLAAIPDAALYQGVDRAKLVFYRGAGCSKCGETGYQGRLSISEVIENTKALSQVIAKGFDQALADKELLDQGFISMMQDGIMKSLLGLTTAEEVVVATKE
ncbi:MAG: type II/IV secretion system protein [Parcubacteria group bacterium]|nr:type II/IV secretion system protein [Parcubacteria group bacterium]